jgi:hypothetical protein
MLKPTSLPTAFGLAILQEEEVLRRNQCPKASYSNSNYSTSRSSYQRIVASLTNTSPLAPNFPPNNHTNAPNVFNTSSNQNTKNSYPNTFFRRPNLPIRRISLGQMQECREKRLCYYCNEKFRPGHKCNRPKGYLLKGLEVEEAATP